MQHLPTLRPVRDQVEALIWVAGVLAVAVADPHGAGILTLCPFDAIGAWMGFSFCPGCGLGHAVGFLVRGHLVDSLNAHPLAIPAVLILTLHVRRLLGTARPDSI